MPGIHHVTAICGKPTHNLDFYTRILGLRFVKKTVNFDDPGTYHLYYGDEVGHPGTILTFFPWEHAVPGRGGVGFAQETALWSALTARKMRSGGATARSLPSTRFSVSMA